MIRAILFDLDGTLIDKASTWRRCVEALMDDRPEVFPPPRRAATLATLARVAGGPFLDRRMYARGLAETAPELGGDAVAIAADLAERLPRAVEPDPAVLAMLEHLSTRYRLAIVTNGSRRVQRAKLERAGLARAVGRVLVSGEVGVRKPDPAIFRRALAWAGADPGEALMVGDHPYEDIHPAQRLGLRTCAVGAYDRGRRPPVSWPDPDWRIDRVTDLPGVLP